MKKTKLAACGCVMALALTMATGYDSSLAKTVKSSDTTTTATATAEPNSTKDKSTHRKHKDDGSKMVQVTKVDGNKITAVVGESMRRKPSSSSTPDTSKDSKTDSSSTNKDSKTDSSSTTKDSKTDSSKATKDSTKTTDSEKSDTKEHKHGHGPRGGKGAFQATDETLTFTITSDTKITKISRSGSTEISASDITEDTILRVIVNEKNEAQTIKVMGGHTK